METKGNDPAMPVMHSDGTFKGMTVRQTFAMAAMQGLLSNPEHMVMHDGKSYMMEDKVYAKQAVEAADALIEALNR